MKRLLVRAALFALPAAALAVPPIIDGQNIPTEFGPAALVATQRFQTQFGDDQSGDQFGGGSELDQMFITNDGTYLYIGLTGNLENNGNCIALFLDTDGPSYGQNTLFTQNGGQPIANLPRFLTGVPGVGLNNLTFDAGFAADRILGLTGGSPLGSQTRSYYAVTWTTLDSVNNGLNHTNQIAGVITAGNATASGPAGTLGAFLQTANLGILGGADNSNDFGVEGGNGLAGNPPASATKGVEVAIPLSLLGIYSGSPVCVFALVSGDSGFMSNQMLPTDDAALSLSNLGTPPFDFSTLSGNQYLCYTIQRTACPRPGCDSGGNDADFDNDCVVGLADLAVQLANFGAAVPYFQNGDANGDGSVNLTDLSILLSRYGNDCR
jgi:hypothetical protein